MLTLQNTSSNVFVQSASQFRVLDAVPNIIQPGANTNQHNTSHVAGAVAIENTDQATPDTANDADLIPPPTPDILSVDNVHLATSELASTSTTTPVEVPQTSNAIPTGTPHTNTGTDPNPTSPTVLATTSTPCVDPVAMKVLFQKRYQHKAKMVPGVAATAR